jgi:hypothetical protein
MPSLTILPFSYLQQRCPCSSNHLPRHPMLLLPPCALSPWPTAELTGATLLYLIMAFLRITFA